MPMLQAFQTSGRKLFIATNSLWDYTNVVMVRAVPRWRSIAVVGMLWWFAGDTHNYCYWHAFPLPYALLL